MCKVDILIPGALGVPYIPKAYLHHDSAISFEAYFPSGNLNSESDPNLQPSMLGIPVVPFPTLLMLQLRSWADHSLSSATDIMNARIPQDEEDIEELLRIGMLLGSEGVVRRPGSTGVMESGGSEDIWILGGFASWKDARKCVRDYVKKWPQTVDAWRGVGFV